jgi:hypothetical protein
MEINLPPLKVMYVFRTRHIDNHSNHLTLFHSFLLACRAWHERAWVTRMMRIFI